ncbi:30S ribosomal protein S9 [Candidatus Bathyarchaeota archaeon]|nr:30S ribosomal protein S9 [Candidatus Bathyarchaeota archaeon]MBS7631888.1 30S ribosomal protein S9 [Candidatus Bathyarchaeota archaeon]
MSSRPKITHAAGKRKTSVARVVIRDGKGRIRVNNIPIHFYEPRYVRDKIMESLIVAGDGIAGAVDIDVKVEGGGYMSQAEAARMGIAQGLVKYTKNTSLREAYIAYDRTMLTGDGRRTESKKFGGPSARTRKQKSYR